MATSSAPKRGQKAGKRRYAPRLPPAERREQLLDAALSVIADQGYGGVSMEAIARVAGVTKPVVYDFFANRGELLMALLAREEERALGLITELMPEDPSDDPDELIAAGFQAFLTSVAENPLTWRLIVLPAESTPGVVREHVESGREQVRERVGELLRWGIEARGGPSPMDIELGAFGLVALGEQFARLVLTDPDRYTPERLGGFVAGLVGMTPRAR